MIRSFRHKGLERYFWQNAVRGIRPDLARRIQVRLRVLHRAKSPGAMNLPGFDFHPLQGRPQRYSVHVNGPWCITFEWDGEDAIRVDLEQYH